MSVGTSHSLPVRTGVLFGGNYASCSEVGQSAWAGEREQCLRLIRLLGSTPTHRLVTMFAVKVNLLKNRTHFPAH